MDDVRARLDEYEEACNAIMRQAETSRIQGKLLARRRKQGTMLTPIEQRLFASNPVSKANENAMNPARAKFIAKLK